MNTQQLDLDKSPDTEVADRIMKAMITKGMGLQEMLEATGLTDSTFRRGLHQHRPDRRSFKIPEYFRIARALDILPSDLMAGAK